MAPVRMSTSDLLETVPLGTASRTVVYRNTVGPQDLPTGSRGKKMSQLFAKYRCVQATIRVESAVPTSAGGQYGAFFDPNPANNWTHADAIGALTSMPVQDVAAAWECLKLNIPPAELQRKTELYTEDITNEVLVSRFGQIVILNLAVSNTTPPGSAEVTVWLDATWEFFEPNASAELSMNPLIFAAGNWTIETNSRITAPDPNLPYTAHTVWRMVPELPGSLFASAEPCLYMAAHDDTTIRFAFLTLDAAQAYAEFGNAVGAVGPSGTPTEALPVEVAVATNRYSPSLAVRHGVSYPIGLN